MTSTIHNLPDGVTPQDTDECAWSRAPYAAGTNKKLNWAQMKAAMAAAISGGSAPAPYATYIITDDGTTTRAYIESTPNALFASNVNSDAVVQAVMDAMDPVNGGEGGHIRFTKQTAGTGYRWTKTVEGPLELATDQAITVSTDVGVIFKPTTTNAFPLFANKQKRVTHNNSTENTNSPTVTVTGNTCSDGSAIPTGGGFLATFNGRLMQYSAFDPVTHTFTISGYAGNAGAAIGAGNGQLVYEAKVVGDPLTVLGTAITIQNLVAGINTPLTVSVVGTAITINLPTDGAGVLVPTTAKAVCDAIRSTPAANALVDVMVGNTNPNPTTGSVAASAVTTLSVASSILPNVTNLYIAGANWQNYLFDFTGAELDATNNASSQCLWVGQMKAGVAGATTSWSYYGNHLNIKNVFVVGGRIVNHPAIGGTYGVFLAIHQHSPREAMQNVMQDVGCFNMKFGLPTNLPSGNCCNNAFAGKISVDPFTCGNQLIDRYYFIENEAFTDGANNLTIFQCGQSARTGWGAVDNNKCTASNDLMVEIDNVQTYCRVTGNEWGDVDSCGTLFYNYNNGAATNPDGSPGSPLIIHEGNRLEMTTTAPAGGGHYLQMYCEGIQLAHDVPYRGVIVDRNNIADWTQAPTAPPVGTMFFCAYGLGGNQIAGNARIVSEGNLVDLGANLHMDPAHSGQTTMVGWSLVSQVGSDFKLSGGAANVLRGTVTWTANFTNQFSMLVISGPWTFDNPQFTADMTFVGNGAGQPTLSAKAVDIGVFYPSSTTVRGRLRIKLKNWGGTTGLDKPCGFNIGSLVGGAQNLTFDKPLIVEYDGAGIVQRTGAAALATTEEITYQGGANTAQGHIQFTQDSTFLVARPLATPAVAATNVPTLNTTGCWCQGYISGGTVTAIKTSMTGAHADAQATPYPDTSEPRCVGVIPPLAGIEATYTVAPTITYIPIHNGPLG